MSTSTLAISRHDDFIRAYHPRLSEKLTTRRVVRDAAILLTLAVAVLEALTYADKSDLLLTTSKIAIIALLLNHRPLRIVAQTPHAGS
jgi:exonuclease I